MKDEWKTGKIKKDKNNKKDKNDKKERNLFMAQLWGGRFTKETDQLVYRFNASIAFDRKFYKQDI